jgi:hypothetical protein
MVSLLVICCLIFMWQGNWVCATLMILSGNMQVCQKYANISFSCIHLCFGICITFTACQMKRRSLLSWLLNTAIY